VIGPPSPFNEESGPDYRDAVIDHFMGEMLHMWYLRFPTFDDYRAWLEQGRELVNRLQRGGKESTPTQPEEVARTPFKENSALFRTFAKVELSMAAILDFANDYGTLSDFCDLFRWVTEIVAMRHTVTVWDYWRHDAEKELRKHFVWRNDDHGKMAVHYDSHPELRPGLSPPAPDRRVVAVVGSETSPDGRWAALQPNNVMLAAQLFLMQVINDHVNRDTDSTLVWDNEEKRPVRTSVPQHLLGTIWLQFEHAVTENKKYLDCPMCGRCIEVSLEAGRSDKEVCGNTCRSTAYRKRKEALKLWAGGKGRSFGEIARQLQLNEGIVEMWISDSQKREEALKMSANGMSVEEIAKKLETDEKKVKRWIPKRKEK
jgi:DNA-binding CsgD family transcriptional regulator